MSRNVFHAVATLESNIEDLERYVSDADKTIEFVNSALTEVRESLVLDVSDTSSRVLLDLIRACKDTLSQFKSCIDDISNPVFNVKVNDHSIVKMVKLWLVRSMQECHNELENRLGVVVELNIISEMACVADDYRRFNDCSYLESMDYVKGLYDGDDNYASVEAIFADRLEIESKKYRNKQSDDTTIAGLSFGQKSTDNEYISFNVVNCSNSEQERIVVCGEFTNRKGKTVTVDLSMHTNSEVADANRKEFAKLPFEEARKLVLESIAVNAQNKAIGIE